MEAGDEFTVAKGLQNLRAHAGHDPHVGNNVCAVRNLNADLGDGRADGAHRERNHVHGAAMHAALVEAGHGLLEFVGIDPVVRRAGVLLFLGGDKRPVLHARNVRRIAAEENATGALFRIELGGRAACYHLGEQAVVFFLGTIAPVDAVGFAHVLDFLDPCEQLFVVCHKYRHLSVFIGNRLRNLIITPF
ncbi:hypothetical protein SDC9_167863 [bioreactor metagenome]|uniref:Uncharacterized protein n=1 Tax=bioreactor metagenome TaxID=1076179 RepID=A0A645G8R6_9ZZZZ